MTGISRLLRVRVWTVWQVGSACNFRASSFVAIDEHTPGAGRDQRAHVPGSVAQRVDCPHIGDHGVIPLYQVENAQVREREVRALHSLAGACIQGFGSPEMLPVGLVQRVPHFGKSRKPPPVVPGQIPADMVVGRMAGRTESTSSNRTLCRRSLFINSG